MKCLSLIACCTLMGAPSSSREGARVVLFQASPSIVKPGAPVELQWMVSGVDKVRIEPTGLEQPAIGKLTVKPTGQTIYWIHAYNKEGGESVPVEVDFLKLSAPTPAMNTSPVIARPPAPPVLQALQPKNPSAPPTLPAPVWGALPKTASAAPLATVRSTPSPIIAPAPMPAPAAVQALRPAPLPKSPLPSPTPVAVVAKAVSLTATNPAITRPTLPPGPPLVAIAPAAPKPEKSMIIPGAALGRGHWIQFIALQDTTRALEMRHEIELLSGHEALCVKGTDRTGMAIHRLRMGPFHSKSAAQGRLKNIQEAVDRLQLKPQVVND